MRDGAVGRVVDSDCLPLVDTRVLVPVEIAAGKQLPGGGARAPYSKVGAHAVDFGREIKIELVGNLWAVLLADQNVQKILSSEHSMSI